MSVIIKGKNPRKPHTVRYWADGRQRERSFATAREATDFKIKTDHDTRAQIFVNDKLGREDTEGYRRGLRDPRRRLQEAPRASGGACLPAEPLSCAALHHARCCGESCGRSARSPAIWPPTRSPMTLRLPAGSGCWPIISSWRRRGPDASVGREGTREGLGG